MGEVAVLYPDLLTDLLAQESFGLIFGIGAIVYGCSFVINGPLTDRIGGGQQPGAPHPGSGPGRGPRPEPRAARLS